MFYDRQTAALRGTVPAQEATAQCSLLSDRAKANDNFAMRTPPDAPGVISLGCGWKKAEGCDTEELFGEFAL